MVFSLKKTTILTTFRFKEILKNRTNIINILLVLALTFGFRLLYSNLAQGDGDSAETALFLSGYVLTLGSLYSVAMIALSTPSTTIAKDKEQNTLRTLMTSSVSGLEYFFSSVIPVVVIAVVLNIAIIFVSGFPLEKINVPLYILVSTLATCTSAIIGMIVGIYSKNQVSAATIMTPIMMLVLMVPLLSNMSDLLATISKFVYTGVLSDMLNAFASSESFTLSIQDYIVLFGSILITTIVFIIIYKKNGYEKD